MYSACMGVNMLINSLRRPIASHLILIVKL